MLTFESPFYEIEDVVVFRDHASPNTFHYLAGPPHLSRPDGKPALLLLKYRHALEALPASAARAREQLGGAFLMLGVDCGLSQARKDDIVRQLESRVVPGSGPVNLVPVLYTKGTVNIIALDAQRAVAGAAEGADPAAQSRFVRGILGTATPSLLQDQRAIFSLSLTPDAATLIEEAYQQDLSPIGVMYELEFAGLRPAIAVRATVDYKRVYDQLKLGVHFGVSTGGGSGTGGGTGGGTSGTAGAAAQPATPQGAAGAAAPAAGGAAAPATGGAAAQPATPAAGAAQPAAGGTAASGSSGSGASGSGTSGRGGSGGGTQLALSADISYAVEKLVQTGAITIEIIRQQEGQSVDQMQTAAMELIKESILKDLFKPAMSAAPAAASPTAAMGAAATAQGLMASTADTSRGTTGSGTKVELGFQLQMKKEEELKTVTFDYSVVAPETRTHSPNGFFSALVSDTERAKQIREIDLDDPFFRILDVDVSTTADFAALDLKSLVVELQYGGTVAAPRVAAAPTFTPGAADPRHFQAALDLGDLSYRYRSSYKFGQAETIASRRQEYQSPWRNTTVRALVVHPPEEVAMLRVFIESGVVDWELIERIETMLAYDDPATGFHTERTYFVDANSPRQEWIVRLDDPDLDTYRVRHRWHLKDHTQIAGEEEVRSERHLFVGDPFVDRLPIVVDPRVDPGNISRIHVEFRYQDPDHHLDIRKHVDLTGPSLQPATVTIPIIDPKRREFDYQVSLIKANGSAETHESKRSDQLSIVVTEGGVYLDVDVVVLGDLAQAGIDALQVDLRAEPLEGQVQRVEDHLFMPGAEKRVSRRLLLRADRPQVFEYKTTVFTPDRAPIESEWKEHSSSILPLQVGRLLVQ